MNTFFRKCFVILALFLSGTVVQADVVKMNAVERQIPKTNPNKLRQVKPEDMVAAPIPDDDTAPTPTGQPKNSTTPGTAATTGTAAVQTTGPGIVVRAPLSEQALIGLIVLALLSLGSVWASVRLLHGEWRNQATEA